MPIFPRVLSMAFLSASIAPAVAQTWPSRPVKVIVSMAAGSGPDIICRLISEKLTAALGQQFVIENKAGGANMIGAVTAAHAPSDGYTLFFATAATLASNPHTFKMPYDPLKDFVMVSIVAKGPFFVLANPKVPANNLAEMIAYSKANPATVICDRRAEKFFRPARFVAE